MLIVLHGKGMLMVMFAKDEFRSMYIRLYECELYAIEIICEH